jgi:hypothetical protein
MSSTVISPSPRARIMGHTLALTAAILSCAAASCRTHGATVIVDSQGFELPKFSPTYSNSSTLYIGQLEGQAPFPEPLPVGTWLRTKNGSSKATVINTLAAPGGGAQSVKVERVANSDDRWAVPVSGWPSERYVCIDWDMRVEQTSLPVGSFGPFFGVEAYDDDAMALGLLASFGVDASNGEVLYQVEGSGVLVAPGPTVAFGAWNRYTILLDYVDHDFELYLNMMPVALPAGTNGFVDHLNIPGGLNEFTDANISTFAAAGDALSQAAAGTAYFDNFSVIQSATNPCIPEPTGSVLGALGMAALALLRRNRPQS